MPHNDCGFVDKNTRSLLYKFIMSIVLWIACGCCCCLCSCNNCNNQLITVDAAAYTCTYKLLQQQPQYRSTFAHQTHRIRSYHNNNNNHHHRHHHHQFRLQRHDRTAPEQWSRWIGTTTYINYIVRSCSSCGSGSCGKCHHLFQHSIQDRNKLVTPTTGTITTMYSSRVSAVAESINSNNSNSSSSDHNGNRKQQFVSTLSNKIPKRILEKMQQLPNIKKIMKLAFYASFVIDATLLLWGGRQAIIALFLSSKTTTTTSNGNTAVSNSIGTVLALTMAQVMQVVRYHILPTITTLWKKSIWKSISRSIIVATILYLFYNMYRTQQRQAIDPTSEWERYAQYPILRTIAIFQLVLFQMIPLSLRIILLQGVQKFTPTISRSTTTKYATAITKIKEQMGYKFSNGLLQLGPLYIKMGQIVSSRDNIVPSEWKDAMERLQDQVPAQTGRRAQQLAYSIWPKGQESFDATFCNVNWTPIAAASLGQVHVATLCSTNERVALKLQRPKLRTIYDNDLQLLKKIAMTVDRFFMSSAGSVGGIAQSWTTIFSDAEEILYREIDYRTEGQNAIRFSTDFGLSKGGTPLAATATSERASTAVATSRDGQPLPSAASWLRTPYVYDTLSTEQVLVMEYVPSIKISAIDTLIQANVTLLDREYLADCLGRSYLRQFCCNRFFSTDPHAGNLGVEILNMESNEPEERVRLVFYDFGQATTLQPNQADGILDIIEAIVDMDVDKSIVSFQKMGVLKDNANLDAVRKKVAENYRTGKVKANRKKLMKRNYQFKDTEAIDSMTASSINTAAATTTIGRNRSSNMKTTSSSTTGSDAQVMQYFTLPAEYAFVGRALSQMDGVGKTLDPEFDFISAAAPYIVEIKGAQRYVQEEFQKWITTICDKIRTTLNLVKR